MKRRDFLTILACASLGLTVMGCKSEAIVEGTIRWGILIDLKKLLEPGLTNRIIEACHSAHNVPSIPNTSKKIQWIWEDTAHHAFSERTSSLPAFLKSLPFLLLCNHCSNPPCVRVCPTGATFQENNGIVGMDYHRCIGCRYCMAACPYGSRSFNYSEPQKFLKKINPDFPSRCKGVVEKCSFCTERLREGKEPICVEVSNGALLFGDINDPKSTISTQLKNSIVMSRKTSLGTGPAVFYRIASTGTF